MRILRIGHLQVGKIVVVIKNMLGLTSLLCLDKIKQRRSKLWEFDTAMDNVECWTRWSNSVLETLAKMDNEE
jgi:hypothetical protein